MILIPGLPNDVASKILSMIPYAHQSRLKQVSRSWLAFLSSKTLIYIRRHVGHLLCVFPQDPSIASPYLFDPESRAWRPLPPMPCNPSVYGLCNFAAVSLGPHLYVIGGSHFDTRTFPMDRPTPSAAVFRYDFLSAAWDPVSPMLAPRGSFACATLPCGGGCGGSIIVAGGGSRHCVFGAAGSRMSSVERYDVARDEWVEMEGLPRWRAGCMGFAAVGGREFWVMGGYGDSRTISGVLPVDEYYKDVVVMDVKGNGWREVGDMWSDGERPRLGKIVVLDDQEEEDRGWRFPRVFMLDNNHIFRYDMASNSWQKEATVPRKAASDSSYGFVVLDGELHVMKLLKGVDSTENRRSRLQKRAGTLFIQIYNPRKKTWRSIFTKPPFRLDFNTAVMCTIRL